jgi:hypothetical protein
VCPALKSAAASPSRTASAATRIDAPGFRLSAAAAGSAISIRSGACRTRTSTAPAARCRDNSRSTTASSPTTRHDGVGRMIPTHRVDRDPQHSLCSRVAG